MKTKSIKQSALTTIDSVLSGIEKKGYIVIGGMPGQGPLTLADRILACIAERHNIPVAYIALKTAPTEQHTNIHVETGSFNIEQIEETISRQRTENGVRLAFIDCLTLIEHPEDIPALSEKLKTMATKEQVAIMIISNSTLEASEKLNPDVLLQIMESSDAKKMDLLVATGKEERTRLTVVFRQ